MDLLKNRLYRPLKLAGRLTEIFDIFPGTKMIWFDEDFNLSISRKGKKGDIELLMNLYKDSEGSDNVEIGGPREQRECGGDGEEMGWERWEDEDGDESVTGRMVETWRPPMGIPIGKRLFGSNLSIDTVDNSLETKSVKPVEKVIPGEKEEDDEVYEDDNNQMFDYKNQNQWPPLRAGVPARLQHNRYWKIIFKNF